MEISLSPGSEQANAIGINHIVFSDNGIIFSVRNIAHMSKKTLHKMRYFQAQYIENFSGNIVIGNHAVTFGKPLKTGDACITIPRSE